MYLLINICSNFINKYMFKPHHNIIGEKAKWHRLRYTGREKNPIFLVQLSLVSVSLVTQ